MSGESDSNGGSELQVRNVQVLLEETSILNVKLSLADEEGVFLETGPIKKPPFDSVNLEHKLIEAEAKKSLQGRRRGSWRNYLIAGNFDDEILHTFCGFWGIRESFIGELMGVVYNMRGRSMEVRTVKVCFHRFAKVFTLESFLLSTVRQILVRSIN